MRTRSSAAGFLAVVLTASAWPLLTTVFASAFVPGALCLVGAAAALSVLAVWGRAERLRFELRYVIAVPPLALAAWLVPWPLSVGAMVLGSALILGALLRPRPRLGDVPAGLALVGVVLTFQALFLGPTLNAMSRLHTVPFVSHVLAWVLNFLGAEAAAGPASVTLATVRECHRFPVGPELLGFPVALAALAGAVVTVMCLSEPRKRLRSVLVVLSVWVVYLPVRAVLLLLVFEQLQLYVGYEADTVRVDILWNGWWQLASFVPLAVLWAAACRTRATPDPVTGPALGRYRPVHHTAALAAALAGAALVGFSLFHHEVGTPKAARVIIQERNSDWEKTTRAPGTQWYGTLSMYNMFSISDYLSCHYDLVRNETVLTGELLKPGDVLILKTPTKAYAPEEVEAVVDFVRGGGGLLMVGEHTNWVGSSVYLNVLARRFGLRLREDCLFDLAGTDPFVQVWRRPADVYHPITAHVPFLRFEVSCSVTPEVLRAEPVMLSTGLFRLTSDYFMENYYPYPRRSSRVSFGPFAQFAACDFGRGRVAVFTDSTTLSNFSAFYPGRAELVLGAVDWLGRTHSSGVWRWVTGMLGVVLLAGGTAALVWLPDRLGGMTLLAAGVVFGCAAAMAAARGSVARNFDPPLPHTPPTHVAFLREHCDYELPVEDFTRNSEKSYDLFNQWVLRLRYFPRVRETLDDALDDDLVVLINPGTIPARDVRLLRRHVETGGKVLVLLSGMQDADALKGLLDAFGLELHPAPPLLQKPVLNADGTPTGVVTDAVVIRGGTMLYRTDGLPVASASSVGDGRFVVVGFGECFRDSEMGYTNAMLPDAQLKARFRLLFRLVQDLLPPEKHLHGKVLEEVERDTAWLK